MKICSKCKKEKNESEFNKNTRNKRTGLSGWCSNCIKEESKKSYLKNKNKILNKSKISGQKKRDLFNKLKEGKKCEKCGYNEYIYALDFHHLDPNEKEIGISEEFTRNKKITDKLLEEMGKCIMLCSNCHRVFHYLEKKEGININEFLKYGK